MGKLEKISSRERTARYRARMRAKGYRLKQIWVPDLRRPEVLARVQAEARAIANSPHEPEDQAWVDEISEPMEEWPAWDPK
jgi:hypothetical protein